MTLETIAALGDDVIITLPLGQRWSGRHQPDDMQVFAASYTN